MSTVLLFPKDSEDDCLVNSDARAQLANNATQLESF